MADYYAQLDACGDRIGTWEFNDRECFRIDSTPTRGGMYHYTAADHAALWALLGEKNSWFRDGEQASFHRLDLAPGRFHPRMARPFDPGAGVEEVSSPGEAEDRSAIAKSRGQLAVLSRALDEICQTIHPEGANLDAYGHDIRNLLILACTEVEAQWRGVLQANGVAPDRPTTADYVMLCRAMRLTEYAVSLSAFPWLAPVAPFRTWSAKGKPTQDLPWYQAYNDTKHDRDRQFHLATLRNAIDAVCALVVMTVAQYGLERALGDGSLLIAQFMLVESPAWTTAESYTVAFDAAGWQPQPCPGLARP
jgi:hypothetical protein